MDPSETTPVSAATAPMQNLYPSTAQIPPTSLPPPHRVTFSQPLAIKLEEKNFLLWCRQVLTAIKGHNLSHYIDRAAKIPPRFASPEDALEDRVSEEFRL